MVLRFNVPECHCTRDFMLYFKYSWSGWSPVKHSLSDALTLFIIRPSAHSVLNLCHYAFWKEKKNTYSSPRGWDMWVFFVQSLIHVPHFHCCTVRNDNTTLHWTVLEDCVVSLAVLSCTSYMSLYVYVKSMSSQITFETAKVIMTFHKWHKTKRYPA